MPAKGVDFFQRGPRVWGASGEDQVGGEVGRSDQNSQETGAWHILQPTSPSAGHTGNPLGLGFLRSRLDGRVSRSTSVPGNNCPDRTCLLFLEQIRTFDPRYVQWGNPLQNTGSNPPEALGPRPAMGYRRKKWPRKQMGSGSLWILPRAQLPR